MGMRLDLFSHVPRLNFLRLRPYGENLATPAVTVWLGFAWVVILLMASIEGIVWGLIGASIVPQGASWLSPVAGLFLFALMFAIIWIVDASLILSERPVLRLRRGIPGTTQGIGPLTRWLFGLLVRVAIVAVSLYVTAPFLAKLIRADDIASYHQRQVEQYFAQRDAALREQVNARTAQIDALYRDRTQPLEAQIERLNQSLTLEREQRARIEAEYAPEIAVLRQDLAAAQARVGDELMGRDGRPEGRGPEARKWEANASRLAEALTAKQAEIDRRLATVAQRIDELEQALRTESGTLRLLRQERQQRLDQATAEETARQVEAQPPRLTFAARSRILQALRESPDERGVPHFETVEGFSQAALGVLFFALIALKLFEPPAVSAYFNESLQLQYRKYLAGGLAEIPGFELPEDPAKRLNPVEFARLWQAFERDPEAFQTRRQALLEIRQPLLKYQAKLSFEEELLARRRENLDQEQDFAQRRRNLELTAYDQELRLRIAQVQAQLDQETKARMDHRRSELANELQQAREEWERHKTQEEESLRQHRETFEQSQALAREELRLRAQEIERLREQHQAAIRQTDLERQQAEQRLIGELDIKRRREALQVRQTGMREEIDRLRGLEARQVAERAALRETGRTLCEGIETCRQKIETAESELAARQAQAATLTRAIAEATAQSAATDRRIKKGFWSRGNASSDTKILRESTRDLKALEKSAHTERERLARLREELQALEIRKLNQDSELDEANTRLSALQARIHFYEDSLGNLLCSGGDEDERTAGAGDQELQRRS
ncbi:hypothetical protein CCR95_05990 [Thiocystis minor]|uniref:hypothetical protein n=1 Tax=Thiocystis minor TaxID=61597 RepID=UPI0019125824|nr:hypothetical protein [Thiocystis minor]MBK5963647.1 hypothetical protein [Thiocystis minor]